MTERPALSKTKPTILIAGGSGFIGSALSSHFANSGYRVTILSRAPKAVNGAEVIYWDGERQGDWERYLEGVTAVVNLCGKSVDCRYTSRNREQILQSRLTPTTTLGSAIARCEIPPRVWLNASTATIYQHTLGSAWDESGTIGATPEAKDDFSVEVAKCWETAFFSAMTPATRKVAMRMSMVLGCSRNSVFPVLCRLARFGLGGRMATGRQYVSWIHIEDLCRAIGWLIDHDELSGAVNVAGPEPLTNSEMMAVIRNVCRVPFGLPHPEWLLEFGALILRTETELVVKSRRVVPSRLLQKGFTFRYPTFAAACANLARGETNKL